MQRLRSIVLMLSLARAGAEECASVATAVLPGVQQNASNVAELPCPGSRTAKAWVEDAVRRERGIIANDGSYPLRYRVRKVDQKGDTERIQIETPMGAVARLVARNGKMLTQAEDAAEQQRLRDVSADPAGFARHHRRDEGTRQDTLDLVRQMPQAMQYTCAEGQPQIQAAGPQVVFDFTPDPAYHPPSMAADMLTGLAGRVWIDTRTGTMVRVEGHVLRPVNFGWGVLGRIYPGGTMTLDQANPVTDRWVYARLETHLSMRVLVKSVSMNDRMEASDFQALPGPVTLQQAVDLLLAIRVPTR